MKISYSKKELYDVCGLKYKFKYIDNLKGNFTSSALLFGTAIDNTLNYILESLRDKKEWSKEEAKNLFIDKMNEWTPELNRLDFFKGDIPNHLTDYQDQEDLNFQEAVWNNLVSRGLDCIDVYINNILPEFEEIISVQSSGSIINEQEDEFIFIADFIAKLKDGRVVLFDNKTSFAKYPKNKVIKSEQLSLYLESFPDIKYCGYIVLIKNPDKVAGPVKTHQILIDEIPEETKAMAFEKLDKALKGIKNKVFEPNLKSCYLYNKKCEYYNFCQYGDPAGLIPNKEIK